MKKGVCAIALSTITALCSCSVALAINDEDLTDGISSQTVDGYDVAWSYNNGELDIVEGEASEDAVSDWLSEFKNCQKVTTLKIKCKNLDQPLNDCFPNLSKIVFDSSLEGLDEYTEIFRGLKNLSSVDLSETSVTSISGGCFSASYIKSITLPKGLKTLGQNALADCGQHSGQGTYGNATEGIETVVIPSGVTSIGQNCFMNLKGLKTVCVPSSVASFNNSQQNMGYGTGSTSQTEIVVYGQDSLADPDWVTTLKSQWRGTRTAMQNVQFAYPGGVIAKAKELSDALAADPTGTGISASTVLDLDAAYGLLTWSQVTAAGYSISENDWNGIATTIDTAWKAVLGSADSSSMSASEKLAQVSEYLAKKQAAYDELVAEFEKAKADLSAAQKAYIAANEVATSVTSMKANYERQLKEAQAKVDEAQAKVEELENLLNPDAVAANKAKIISLQDKLAISAIGGGSKVVKLNKKGKTKAKATVKLKLVKSESGAAVACAKAKGTNKNVTVSNDGVLILKKGVKKGKYKAKVKLTCGNATKTITYTFKAA